MIVFDTSTLILLAKLELLDIFLGDYKGQVLIPNEVEKEATAKKTYDGLLIGKRVVEKQIAVVKAQEGIAEKLMRDFNLNMGEAEAIAVAKEKNGALLATDDKNAIKACKLLNISFATAITFIVRAHEKSLLSQTDALAKLAKLAKFGRYEETIIKEAQLKITGGKNAENTKRKD